MRSTAKPISHAGFMHGAPSSQRTARVGLVVVRRRGKQTRIVCERGLGLLPPQPTETAQVKNLCSALVRLGRQSGQRARATANDTRGDSRPNGRAIRPAGVTPGPHHNPLPPTSHLTGALRRPGTARDDRRGKTVRTRSLGGGASRMFIGRQSSLPQRNSTTAGIPPMPAGREREAPIPVCASAQSVPGHPFFSAREGQGIQPARTANGPFAFPVPQQKKTPPIRAGRR